MKQVGNKGFANFYSQYSILFYIIVLIIIVTIPLCYQYDQSEQFMAVNRLHNTTLDWFFRVYTNVGDGLFMVAVALILLFKRIKYAILIITSFLLSGLVAQLIKKSVKMPRPGKVFEGNPDWYTLPDYHIHGNYSFPSGHTTTVFAMMVIVYYIFPKQLRSPLLFILACLAGYSRVYLSQHWPIDVYAGSVLGMLVTLVVIYVFEQSGWYTKNWANKSILHLKKSNTEL